ncbi:MAG TPA: zf-HC2 domain-containing protein [Vicinamibacterales bacterium]|nr:zf-HC2 domain-containing protein [Vicinamibacterales bacterium]
MHTEWTDRLSDYLDDELTAGERREVDAHLAGCAECRAVLDELQQVVARARTVEPRPPHADLWPGVARRIETPVMRRLAFTLPQALAASLVIALLSGAVVWKAMERRSADAIRSAEASRSSTASRSAPVEREPSGERPDVATVSYADAQYDAAVSDLEKAVKEGRGRLDASTVAIVEHNLQIIDQAIDQARQALDADPANSYLSSHLVEARRRKLDLLRRAAALTEGD